MSKPCLFVSLAMIFDRSCVPMRERKECHCMLFLTEENDFVGESVDISVEEINTLTA